MLSGVFNPFCESFPLQLVAHPGSDFEGFTREQAFAIFLKTGPFFTRLACQPLLDQSSQLRTILLPRKTFEARPWMSYQLQWKLSQKGLNTRDNKSIILSFPRDTAAEMV